MSAVHFTLNEYWKTAGADPGLHKGFRASDRRRQEHVGGSGGMPPLEILKDNVLRNAISNILRGNLINLSNDI